MFWYVQEAAVRPFNMPRSRVRKEEAERVEAGAVGRDLNPENLPDRACSSGREIFATGCPFFR